MNFKDQVVIVTGASRGIGKEIAIQFAEHGAKVACIATKVENAESTVKIITGQNKYAKAYGGDISLKDDINSIINQISHDLGNPTVLINNAGITRDTLMIRMKDSDWNDVINVNLKGPFLFTQAVARLMMKARYGRIINISSIVGLLGAAGQVNYAASKAGLIGMSKSIAKEFGSRGITSNVVAPGFIHSDMTQDLSQEMKDHYVKVAPIGRLGEPKDIAAAVIFLASKEAGFITGQTLTVDGGFSLG